MKQMNYEYCNGFTHTIKKGDTLYEISRRHNVPLALLLRANPYVDVFNLQVGDTICIPSESSQIVPYPVNSMPRPIERDNDRDGDDRFDDDRFDNDRDNDDRFDDDRFDNDRDNDDRFDDDRFDNDRDNDDRFDDDRFDNDRDDDDRFDDDRFDNDRDDDDRFDDDRFDNDRDDDDRFNNRRTDSVPNMSQQQENTMQVNTDEMEWIKYVVKPGDTLEDILEQMEGSVDDFVKRNGLSSIYMLPGIAYYIPKRK